MSRKSRAVACVLFAMSIVPAAVAAQSAAKHLKNGAKAEIVKIDAGHTLVAKIDGSGSKVPVRVLGINCATTKKTFSTANKLLLGEQVTLESDKSFLPILQDQSGNFIAYVRLDDGSDYGKKMIEQGVCTDKSWKHPHPRATLYAQVRQN